MSGIKVSFAELSAAAGEISSSARTVEQQLNDLQDEVTRKLATWEGNSSGAYKEAQDKWTRAATDLQAVLASIGSAVQQASDAYAAAEQRNNARW